MRPLELDETTRAIEKLLGNADVSEVRRAIADCREASGSDARSAAALMFADGALLLREGSLETAAQAFRSAARYFADLGEVEAGELAQVEAAVADARRGVRDLASASRAAMADLAERGSTPRVRVAALIVRGTADRVLGDAASAHEAFLEAKERATFPELKTQALNSLGTLYVVTGALGAAKSVLETAAELCHARGDSVGEAIAMGQLGAVAMGLGDLELARRHLSRQEWLAQKVGDAFGRARALTWLAEVALELGAPDDAIEIATRAHAVADAAGLGTFKAYADRVIGRAKRELGEEGAPFSERALHVFQSQRLPLGEALSTWDLALASRPIDREAIQRALAGLASLGLVDRVLEVLLDLRESGADASTTRVPDVRLLLMASALSGRKAEALETQLVHEDPVELARSVAEKTAAKRNLARLSAQAVDAPGLTVLAVSRGREPSVLLGDRTFTGALAGQIGQACLFVWSGHTEIAALARDVTLVFGEGTVGVLDHAPDARIAAPGFGAGFGARLEGVDIEEMLTTLFDPGRSSSLRFGGGVDRASAWAVAVDAALTSLGLAPEPPSS